MPTTTALDGDSMPARDPRKVFFTRAWTDSDNEEGRLGRLRFEDRTVIDTPYYIAVSSRGAVPHLSQDMMRSNTSIKGIYTAVEDCEFTIYITHSSR